MIKTHPKINDLIIYDDCGSLFYAVITDIVNHTYFVEDKAFKKKEGNHELSECISISKGQITKHFISIKFEEYLAKHPEEFI